MKKYLIAGILILFVSIAVFADDSAFYNALKNCSSYSNSGTVNTEGMDVNFRNNINGWVDGKCVYKEYVNMQGVESCVTCKFTKNQLNELVNVMRAYSIVQGYTGESVDTSSLSGVQNNPVVKVWNKYLNDSSVCNTEINRN